MQGDGKHSGIEGGGGKSSAAIGWSPPMEEAFEAAKAALAAAATLAHPLLMAELGLVMDASSSHMGAALQQCRGAVVAAENHLVFSLGS